MKRFFLGFIIIILVASVAWSFFHWSRTYSTNTSINQTFKNTSTVSFRDMCDCYAFVAESRQIERMDVATGERRPLLSAAAQRLIPDYSWLEFSPDGRKAALVSTDLSSVYFVDAATGEANTAYTTPGGDAIVSLIWAGNSNKIVVSVGSRQSADVPTAIAPDRLILVDAASKLTKGIVDVAKNPNLVSLIQRPMFVSNDGGMIFFADTQGKQWQWRSDSAAISELSSVIDFGISFSEQDSSPIYARIIGDRAVFGYRTKIRIVSLVDFSEKVIELKTATDQPFGEPNPDQNALLLIQTNDQGSAAKLVRLSLPTGVMTTVLDPYPANFGLADLKWTPDGSSFVVSQYGGAKMFFGRLTGDSIVLKELSDVPTVIQTFASKTPAADAKEINALVGRIGAWDQYKPDATVDVGSGDCGRGEFSTTVNELNAETPKVQRLNDGLELVVTPNPRHWTDTQFLDFINDNKAICAAGGIYPLRAYPGKLLWKGVCGTGAEPPPGPAHDQFERCLKAEAAVSVWTVTIP